MNASVFFELRRKLPNHVHIMLEILGGFLLLAAWQATASLHLLKNGIVPSPMSVLEAFPVLWFKYDLLGNALYSVTLNLLGYLEAAIIGLPLGFLIGLNPLCRALMGRYTTALRYLPLSALLGPFMLLFGIATNMKMQFLAFGILVYIIPQVVQRIDEVESVYLQTMQTIGASKWQIIRRIYIPAVIARTFTDFVTLTGISWTYIIIAEVVNTSDGGIGALAYMSYRTSHTDRMYAALIVIVAIGFALDKLGNFFDRKMFRWKYIGEGENQ